MELLYLSPEFPPNYSNFILKLDETNVNVWGRGKRITDYVHSHSDIQDAYGHCLVEFAENPPIFQRAMGKYRYILRSASESDILRMADFVLRKPLRENQLLSIKVKNNEYRISLPSFPP